MSKIILPKHPLTQSIAPNMSQSLHTSCVKIYPSFEQVFSLFQSQECVESLDHVSVLCTDMINGLGCYAVNSGS